MRASQGTPLNVAAVGSRSTAMPLTLSFGRSTAEVSVTGSVMSKPSIQSGDSCGRVPPMRSRPSEPRRTEGSSGSDWRMRGRGSGRRSASVAVIVLPRVSMAAPDEVSADAVTSSASVVRPTTIVIRRASPADTVAVSNPSNRVESCRRAETPGSRRCRPLPSSGLRRRDRRGRARSAPRAAAGSSGPPRTTRISLCACKRTPP